MAQQNLYCDITRRHEASRMAEFYVGYCRNVESVNGLFPPVIRSIPTPAVNITGLRGTIQIEGMVGETNSTHLGNLKNNMDGEGVLTTTLENNSLRRLYIAFLGLPDERVGDVVRNNGRKPETAAVTNVELMTMMYLRYVCQHDKDTKFFRNTDFPYRSEKFVGLLWDRCGRGVEVEGELGGDGLHSPYLEFLNSYVGRMMNYENEVAAEEELRREEGTILADDSDLPVIQRMNSD